MKKSNVYTKTGDKGQTSLVGGTRVLKSDDRLEAYGTVDELNAYVGWLNCRIDDQKTKDFLTFVQNRLFTIGAILATENAEMAVKYGCQIIADDVIRIESEIDITDCLLPKLNLFIIPGGSEVSALAHVCRTVCRRAERRIVALDSHIEIDVALQVFINRLSDYFFVLSRKLALDENQTETFWIPNPDSK